MKDAIDIKLLGGGQNWMALCTRIAIGLNGYYSPLPKGSSVSVTTREPGSNIFEGPMLVARGVYHMAVTTPSWVGKLAAAGRPPFSEPLPLSSLAQFAHDDQLVFAVRRETGIRTLREIKEKQYPLKVSTPLRETRHAAVWCAERVLEEYGFNFDDIERWGGKVLRDRPRNQKSPGVQPVSEGFDAIFDEAIMTNRWKALTEKYDVEFLPIDEEIIERFVQRGWSRGVLPMRRFRGIDCDVPGIDFSGWFLFCRQDMEEELAYYTIQAIDDQQHLINQWFDEPASGMTAHVDMRRLAHGLPLPLHPGAEAYYREKGYL
jgi:TRAP-type uncharacterized transport system substrate-binding protein